MKELELLEGGIFALHRKIERRILRKMSAGMRDVVMGGFIRGGDFQRGLYYRLISYLHLDSIEYVPWLIADAVERSLGGKE